IFVGGAVVAGAGLFVIWRERCLALLRVREAAGLLVVDRDRLHLAAEVTIDEAEEGLQQAALVRRGARADFCADLLGRLALEIDRALETFVSPGRRAGVCTPLTSKCAAAFLANVCLAFHQGSVERRLAPRDDLYQLHGRPPWDE